jgi:hypothetical protein
VREDVREEVDGRVAEQQNPHGAPSIEVRITCMSKYSDRVIT